MSHSKNSHTFSAFIINENSNSRIVWILFKSTVAIKLKNMVARISIHCCFLLWLDYCLHTVLYKIDYETISVIWCTNAFLHLIRLAAILMQIENTENGGKSVDLILIMSIKNGNSIQWILYPNAIVITRLQQPAYLCIM